MSHFALRRIGIGRHPVERGGLACEDAGYLLSTCVIGLICTAVTSTILALPDYSFNIFSLSWALVPFVFNLFVFDWTLGMISTALIVRCGPVAEMLAWAVPFFIQPFVAAYYLVSVLPTVLQWLSLSLPCS